MATTGITPSDELINEFNELKLRQKYKYMIVRLKQVDSRTWEYTPEHMEPGCSDEENETKYNEMRDRLLADEKDPAYVVFDFTATTDDGRPLKKLLFIKWASDNCPMKKKMIFASSADSLKNKFVGVMEKSLDASDPDELSYESAKKLVMG